MKQAPQAYPDNPGPIKRTDGSYVYYDRFAAGTTSRPWLPGHRGWRAVGPDGESLGYFPRFRARPGHSWMRVPRKFKTATHALKALDQLFPLKKRAQPGCDGL